MSDKVYSEQEVEIIKLNLHQSHAFKSIDRLDNSIHVLSNKFDTFKYWVISLMVVQFGLILMLFKR